MKLSDLTDLIPGAAQLKLIAAGVGTAAVLGGLSWIYLHGRHDAAAELKPKVAAAQAQAATTTVQGALTGQAAAIPAAADRRALDITVHTETAAHAVEQAHGASGAVPPDVLRSWGAGVDGVRDEADRAHAADPAAPHPGGGQPAGAVPPA